MDQTERLLDSLLLNSTYRLVLFFHMVIDDPDWKSVGILQSVIIHITIGEYLQSMWLISFPLTNEYSFTLSITFSAYML